MMDFILKIYNLLNIKPDRYFFSSKYLSYIKLCIFMLSRLFSNYLKIIKIKDRRLCWISYWKYYNLLKVKPDQYFFTSKWLSNILLCIFMLSRLYSNHLKIIKIKDRRLCWISYWKFTICWISNPIDIFSPQNSSVIYNYIFLCYLDCFQIHLKIIKIKDRRLCWISYWKFYNLLKVKPDQYFFTSK